MTPAGDGPRPRIRELLEAGEAFCLATVVASRDPAVRVGARAVVRGDGTAEGELGDEGVGREVHRLAREALGRRRRGLVEPRPGLQVFLDVMAPEAELLVCGAGHIAVPLAAFARQLGFAVTVLDDRADFARPDRFPGCEVVAEDFVGALRRLPLGPDTYVVVITRGHEHDAECLAEVLPKPTAYVGLIGSRRRVAFVLEMLGREGVPAERLTEVFTPIGVPLGAESPEEIALSIASELVCVRRKGPEQARALRDAAGGSR
ncbi:MAG: XdhC/CoxI family protein [Deferrisomatales bacterium]|nr:XdhC/CoxI family protein [Deferrisomatales bacterium]